MANLNKVFLIGRLTADPELKKTPNEKSVCSFSIAINRRSAKGEKPIADFIDCVAWNGQAEFVSKYFEKGSPIFVGGEIHVRPWKDKDGNNRRAIEVIGNDIQFVDSKAKKDEEHEQNYDEFVEVSEDEEELPF